MTTQTTMSVTVRRPKRSLTRNNQAGVSSSIVKNTGPIRLTTRESAKFSTLRRRTRTRNAIMPRTSTPSTPTTSPSTSKRPPSYTFYKRKPRRKRRSGSRLIRSSSKRKLISQTATPAKAKFRSAKNLNTRRRRKNRRSSTLKALALVAAPRRAAQTVNRTSVASRKIIC
jgi:hypothetical protein